MVRHLLTVAALSALLARPAADQNNYQQQITSQFTQLVSLMQSRGYAQLGQTLTGSLNNQTDESLVVNLNTGTHYLIAAACDADCDDVDLQIFSSDGTKLGEDMLTDKHPIVEFDTAYSGQYHVKVLMPSCKANPCYYGVQIYQQTGK